MDDLTKFIKPLSKQTSWAELWMMTLQMKILTSVTSRRFQENQNSNDYADAGLQQKSSKVVQVYLLPPCFAVRQEKRTRLL